MQTIDIISFLQNYYGIYHESLVFSKLKHEDIPKLFPFVRTCQKTYINLVDLQNGDVIGVYDKNNHVLFYYNPHLILDNTIIPSYEETFEEEKEISLDNLDDLSKEELLMIRRKLRLADRRKDSYLINRLIRKIKMSEPIFYREKKRKLLLKEIYYD